MLKEVGEEFGAAPIIEGKFLMFPLLIVHLKTCINRSLVEEQHAPQHTIHAKIECVSLVISSFK